MDALERYKNMVGNCLMMTFTERVERNYLGKSMHSHTQLKLLGKGRPQPKDSGASAAKQISIRRNPLLPSAMAVYGCEPPCASPAQQRGTIFFCCLRYYSVGCISAKDLLACDTGALT